MRGHFPSALLWASVLLTSPAWAQTEVTQMAQGLSGPQIDPSLTDLRSTFTRIEAIRIPEFATSAPAYTIAVPAGYGVAKGTAYVVVGGVFEGRDRPGGQAGIGLGLGIGDPNSLVGLEVSYALVDVERGLGGFNAKLHRNLFSSSQGSWSLAAGIEDLATTGRTGRESSVYGSTTAIFRLNSDINDLFSRLALTVGVGGGRFRSEDDILRRRGSVGLFGAAALRVSRSISIIGEWTGQDLAAGISFAPFSEVNFYVTPAVRDLAGTGSRARFSISSGLSLQF